MSGDKKEVEAIYITELKKWVSGSKEVEKQLKQFHDIVKSGGLAKFKDRTGIDIEHILLVKQETPAVYTKENKLALNVAWRVSDFWIARYPTVTKNPIITEESGIKYVSSLAKGHDLPTQTHLYQMIQQLIIVDELCIGRELNVSISIKDLDDVFK